MKTITMTTLLSACLAAGAAFADDAESISRAQVRADLQAAQASGEHAALLGEDSGSAWLSRQALPAAAAAALPPAADRDLASALIGEDSGSFALSAQLSRQLRAQAATLMAQRAPH